MLKSLDSNHLRQDFGDVSLSLKFLSDMRLTKFMKLAASFLVLSTSGPFLLKSTILGCAFSKQNANENELNHQSRPV